MNQSLNGKVAIVTGASSGIGRAVAYEFARQGVKQVLTARSKDRLAAVAEDLDSEAIIVQADMTSPKDIRLIVERGIAEFGRIDILLANAGIYISGGYYRRRTGCLGPTDQHKCDGSVPAGPRCLALSFGAALRGHSGDQLHFGASSDPMGTDL